MMEDQSEDCYWGGQALGIVAWVANFISDVKLCTMKIEDITSDQINRDILRKLKENDPSLDFIWVGVATSETNSPDYRMNNPEDDDDYYLGSQLELHALANALRTNCTLQGISLGGTHMRSMYEMTNEGARSLADALRTNQNLKCLCLHSTEIGNEGARALAHALAANCTLEILSLEYNNINDGGAHALEDALCTNISLKMLRLSGHKISNEGVRALAHALGANCTWEELNLYQNEFGSEGVQALAEALGANRSLKKLEIHNNQIGNEGARVLADSLGINHSLKILDIHDAEFGSEGARAFADALRTNCTLEDLNLNDNEIGDEGARVLADSLGTNHSLKILRLGWNEIGDEGARAFALALGANCNLEVLYLNDNEIGNEEALFFASALANNSNLTRLSFYDQYENDEINDETCTKFSELLCDVSSINSTYFSNHTLQYLSCDSDGVHDELDSYLSLNDVKCNMALVRMEKIFKYHRYFDMKPFFECGWKMLPYVFDWLERVRSRASSNPAQNCDEIDSDNTIEIEEERIMNEKLNAIHQFAHAIPEIFDREAQSGVRMKSGTC